MLLNASPRGNPCNYSHPFLRGDACAPIGRQFRDTQRSIPALPKRSHTRLSKLTLREVGPASRSDFPHLYGTSPKVRYLPWGQGTEAGYGRACSTHLEVALRGIVLWLAVACHETRTSSHANLQQQHRKLMQLLRELKDIHSSNAARHRAPASATA